jgi:hypothetical protein
MNDVCACAPRLIVAVPKARPCVVTQNNRHVGGLVRDIGQRKSGRNAVRVIEGQDVGGSVARLERYESRNTGGAGKDHQQSAGEGPDLRYQHASDIRADLKRLRRDTSSGRISSAGSKAVPEIATEAATGSTVAAQPSAGLAQKPYILLAVCCAVLAAAYVAYRFWPRSKTPSSPPKITQISQWNKPMNGARLSPDGHAVAFGSPVRGVAQVFLMLTSGGEPLQLTNDQGVKYVNTFSPDGREVFYFRSLGRDEVWAVTTLGGAPRRVVSDALYVLPSLDGAFIYFAKQCAGFFVRQNPCAQAPCSQIVWDLREAHDANAHTKCQGYEFRAPLAADYDCRRQGKLKAL